MIRLLDILQEVARDRVLGDRFALKGGTALNVFHLGLDRLSVDIDLNYVGALERGVMVTEWPKVEAALNRLLVSQGYTIRHQPDKHAGGKWIMRFASTLGGNATLELDVNYMARQPFLGTARVSSAALGDMRAREVPVLDLQETIAGKLVALFDRYAARDLFDARRILSIEGLDWKNIKAALLALGACARRDWRMVSTDAIKGDSQEFRRKLLICPLRGCFGGKDAIDAWIKETVVLCRKRFAFLFDLSADERAFLDSVLDRGEVNADLLDVPIDIRARIATMPMLAWKCRNVHRHRNLGVG